MNYLKIHTTKIFYCILVVLLAILALTWTPLGSYNAQAASSWTGLTQYWSNIRTGPGTTYPVITTYAPYTQVTVYNAVVGESVNGGSSTWYRISSQTDSPKYIYAGLVMKTTPASAPIGMGNPSSQGKEIDVSVTKQWLYAYDNGKLVLNAAIMSGRPSLPTPLGTYHIFAKFSPTTFTSPWPKGSPYYYEPTHINYALEFKEGGYFLHDAYWHSVFGPGTNVYHYDPQWGWQWGSHGCVAMPNNTAAWIYNWAPIGTTVKILP